MSRYDSIQNYFDPKYDSDKELSEEEQKKIREASDTEVEQVRKDAWNKAGIYPKIMSTLKGVWDKDKRSPK